MYEAYLGCDKENCPDVSTVTLGRVLKKVFPSVIKTKGRIEKGKKPVYVYLGITMKANDPLGHSSVEDSWNELCEQYQFPGWFKTTTNENEVAFLRVLSVSCEGRKVVQEIRIFRDWTLEMKVMGKTVPKENIGSVVISVDSKKSSLDHRKVISYCLTSKRL